MKKISFLGIFIYISLISFSQRLIITNETPIIDLDNTTAGNNYATSFTEDAGNIAISNSATITDSDNTTLNSATISLTNNLDGIAREKISLTTTQINDALINFGITVNVATNNVISLSGSSLIANYQTVINQIVYNNTSQNPTTTDRVITVVANDGNANSNIATTTVSISKIITSVIANKDITSTNEETTKIINVVTNDIDVDTGFNLSSLKIKTNPLNGNATANFDGTISYIGNNNFFGKDSLIYEICGNNGTCDTAYVIIDVIKRSTSNNALDFDGKDDMVYFPIHSLVGKKNYTIEAKILNVIENANAKIIMQFYDGASDKRLEIRIDKSNLSIYSSVLGLKISTYKMPINTSFHMTLSKQENTTKMYVDGFEVLSFDGSYNLPTALRIGRYFSSTTANFIGEIDELRMWDKAFEGTSKQCTLKGNETNLVGYWDFNQGIANDINTNDTLLLDRVGENNGLVQNFNFDGTTSNWINASNCSPILEVTNSNKEEKIIVYPNPFTTSINISDKLVTNGSIEIYDITGQLIMSQNIDNEKIMLDVNQGIYIIYVKDVNNNILHIEKIIKQ